jgi:dihydroxy-acid dehydratase
MDRGWARKCFITDGHSCKLVSAGHVGPKPNYGPIALPDGDRSVRTPSAHYCNVSDAEFATRKKSWKPKDHGYGSGALWKYAQQVGPAVSGAVTHPGGSAEGVCYADI